MRRMLACLSFLSLALLTTAFSYGKKEAPTSLPPRSAPKLCETLSPSQICGSITKMQSVPGGCKFILRAPATGRSLISKQACPPSLPVGYSMPSPRSSGLNADVILQNQFRTVVQVVERATSEPYCIVSERITDPRLRRYWKLSDQKDVDWQEGVSFECPSIESGDVRLVRVNWTFRVHNTEGWWSPKVNADWTAEAE